MLLWLLAGFSVSLVLGLFLTMVYVVAKGSRAERLHLLNHSCKHCGYDLSQTSLWPRRAGDGGRGGGRAGPDPKNPPELPKCPECGRLITGVPGIDLPDSLPTQVGSQGPSSP